MNRSQHPRELKHYDVLLTIDDMTNINIALLAISNFGLFLKQVRPSYDPSDDSIYIVISFAAKNQDHKFEMEKAIDDWIENTYMMVDQNKPIVIMGDYY